MTTTYTAAQAIERSISHDEIVYVDYDEAVAADLLVECEDSVDAVESYGVTEYTGVQDDGESKPQPWRVHMYSPNSQAR